MQVRYSRLHNASMALAAVAMVLAALVHFGLNPERAPTLSPNDARTVLFLVLSTAMGFYAWLGVQRLRDRSPQIVIDADGIAFGFGRNRRFPWKDIQWVRLRRLAFRPQLQIGLAPEAFIAADLRLTTWNLDDALRPVRGTPAAVLVRDNGLDTSARAMLDAIRALRPNLVET